MKHSAYQILNSQAQKRQKGQRLSPPLKRNTQNQHWQSPEADGDLKRHKPEGLVGLELYVGKDRSGMNNSPPEIQNRPNQSNPLATALALKARGS
jgi:hypothetical protein